MTGARASARPLGHWRVWQPLLYGACLAVVLWGPKLWCVLVGAVALFRFAANMSPTKIK